MKTPRAFWLLLAQCQFAVNMMLGQGAITWIGPSIRNGSFEDGVAAPWGISTGTVLQQDSAFASHGSWYALFSRPGNGLTVRDGVWQYLPFNPADGRVFLLSFDARTGSPGFNELWPAVEGATLTAAQAPPLSTSAWASYQYRFEFPSTRPEGTIRLSILFSKTNAVVGLTYTAYLDNVVLQQIPEPSVWALAAVGGGLLLCALRLGANRNPSAPAAFRRLDRPRAKAPGSLPKERN